jgi:hypothetical protein
MSHDETNTRYLQPHSSTFPSQSTNNSRGNGNGPFDPGNTPPLVFAFIAIGFVAFGLIIAIVYKKCRPLQNSRGPHHQSSSLPTRRLSAQKPKLWDVWIAPNQRVLDAERTSANDWDTLVVSHFSCWHAAVLVDQFVDECPSPYQHHLYTLILPLPPFACPSNMYKVAPYDLFPWKTPNTGCSSDDRQKTQASVSQSWLPCPNHPKTENPSRIGRIPRTSFMSV